jgi:Toprim-like
VHITRLLPDGSDRERGKGAKITIARSLGMPIAVSSITDGLSLCITEGIEDALAFAVAGHAAWATGSAPVMPDLAKSIPDYITTVIIEQHPDPDGQAQRATMRLVELLRKREPRKSERPIEIIIRKATS